MSVYVMSDIHGRYDRFFLMLNKIHLKKNDKVYILGDVIDRGPDGIEILKYIMKDYRFTLLIGNHEKMMLDYFHEIKKENVDFYYEQIWLINGCTPTKKAFDLLDKKQQEDILNYLSNCPVVIADLKVNQRLYYLVHGSPDTSITKGVLYLHSKNVNDSLLHRFVWERVKKEQKGFKDRCVIFGHTMTFYYQNVIPYKIWSDHDDLFKAHWIGLDCGCAKNDIYSRLSVLRLDDMKVFYV